jgi:hypothetical protein
MNNIIKGLVLTISIIAFVPSPAHATIDRILDDAICLHYGSCDPKDPYPIRQGQTVTVTVQGQFVDLSTSLEVTGSGVTVQSLGTASGSKTMRIQVASDADPGQRTVKLRYLVETNGPDTFKVVVLRKGSISHVTIPTPTARFDDLNITFAGNKIDNAGVFELPSEPASEGHVLSASVQSNTSTSAVANVRFYGAPLVRTNGIIRLGDKAGGIACMHDTRYCYTLSDGGANIHIAVVGPNFVSSFQEISIPFGTTEDELLTMRVSLRESAKSGGEKVFWQLTPSTSFVATSGTVFSQTGLNNVTIPAGQKSVELTVKLDKVPSGCPYVGCVGQIQAKTEHEPEFNIQTFTMRPRLLRLDAPIRILERP